MIPLTAVAFLVLCAIALRLRRRRTDFANRSQGHPLPPGPSGLPVIGNLFDFPDASAPWLGYRDLSRRYGVFPDHSSSLLERYTEGLQGT